MKKILFKVLGTIASVGIVIVVAVSCYSLGKDSKKPTLSKEQLEEELIKKYETVLYLNTLESTEEKQEIDMAGIKEEEGTYYIDYNQYIEQYNMDEELEAYVNLCDTVQHTGPNVEDYYKVLNNSLNYLDKYPNSQYEEYVTSLIQVFSKEYFLMGELFIDNVSNTVTAEAINAYRLIGEQETGKLSEITKEFEKILEANEYIVNANVLAKGIDSIKKLNGNE